MPRSVILRFRDLITDVGGTIAEHRSILRSNGEVWWGWWMRQHEVSPRALFAQLREEIDACGTVLGYLFDSGTGSLFSCRLADIKVAPGDTRIGPPDPGRSPEYYQRGRYPAWFLLRSIDDQRFGDLEWVYEAFPTRPELPDGLRQLLGQPVASVEQLRETGVTLWVIREVQTRELEGD